MPRQLPGSVTAPLLWMGVMAHRDHAAGRLPACAHALNNAPTTGASTPEAARSASTDRKPKVADPLRSIRIPWLTSAAVNGTLSSAPSAERVACAALQTCAS